MCVKIVVFDCDFFFSFFIGVCKIRVCFVVIFFCFVIVLYDSVWICCWFYSLCMYVLYLLCFFVFDYYIVDLFCYFVKID